MAGRQQGRPARPVTWYLIKVDTVSLLLPTNTARRTLNWQQATTERISHLYTLFYHLAGHQTLIWYLYLNSFLTGLLNKSYTCFITLRKQFSGYWSKTSTNVEWGDSEESYNQYILYFIMELIMISTCFLTKLYSIYSMRRYLSVKVYIIVKVKYFY